MTVGLLLTALTLGLRHGLDWDHLAAIADLSSSSETRRRGLVLSFLYAGGHALIVLLLGVLAILFGSTLPDGTDAWMGRAVGLTLIVLGAWIVVDLVRSGRDFRLRSRWILILGGTFAGVRRIRDATSRRRVALTHQHEHPHEPVTDHDQMQAHDHAHVEEGATAEPPSDAALTAAARAGDSQHQHTGRQHLEDRRVAESGFDSRRLPIGPGHRHSHSHHHELFLRGSQPTGSAGNGAAAGIGVLHGIGFESPTQIAVFVASTSVVGATTGVALLSAWIVGLFVSNSLLAGLAALGLLGAERNFTLYATIAVVVGLASISMGTLLVAGLDVVPELAG